MCEHTANDEFVFKFTKFQLNQKMLKEHHHPTPLTLSLGHQRAD